MVISSRIVALFCLSAVFLVAPYVFDASLKFEWKAQILSWVTLSLMLLAQAHDRLILALFNAFALFFVFLPFIYQSAFAYDLNSRWHVQPLSWAAFLSFLLYITSVNVVALPKIKVCGQARADTFGKSLSPSGGFLASVVAVLIFVVAFGAEALIYSRTEQTMQLDTGNYARFIGDALQVTPYIIALAIGSQSKRLGPFYWAIVLLGLAVCNPINSPRIFALAGLLIAITPVLRRTRLYRTLPLIFAGGMYILMPVTSALRYGIDGANSGLDLILFSAEFSAMQVLEDGLQHFQHATLGFGRYLGSAILIFFPRAIWPNKNTGTGLTIGEYSGYPNTNVSVSPHFDAWLDFGWPGVVVLGLLVGWFFRVLTKWSRNGYAEQGWRAHIFVVFLFCVPIFVRGDSMTAARVIYDFLLACGAVALIIATFGRPSVRYTPDDRASSRTHSERAVYD